MFQRKGSGFICSAAAWGAFNLATAWETLRRINQLSAIYGIASARGPYSSRQMPLIKPRQSKPTPHRIA
jgi:hypothetical protein